MVDKYEMTTGDFINKFDHFRRIPDTGNVLIHLGITYGFVELKADFLDKLKNDLMKKISMAQHDIDKLSPTEKFAIMLLQDAY